MDKVSIPPGDLETLWRETHERQSFAARESAYQPFPGLADRAKTEAANFARLSIPVSAHDLNLRRVQASQMLANWGAELTSRVIGSQRA